MAEARRVQEKVEMAAGYRVHSLGCGRQGLASPSCSL